jgi:hypothetical protein
MTSDDLDDLAALLGDPLTLRTAGSSSATAA